LDVERGAGNVCKEHDGEGAGHRIEDVFFLGGEAHEECAENDRIDDGIAGDVAGIEPVGVGDER
jgi:hypothetical protein